jgi:hypothetical protein
MNPDTACAWSNLEPLPSWQWVRETPVAILEENELPAWRDPDQVLRALEEMGARFLRYPAIGWGAHFCSESNYVPKYPGLEGRDLFGEISRATRANGVKLMAYFHYGVLYRFLETLHPEWLATDAEGIPLTWNGYHRMSCLCRRPFVQAMQGAILEVVERYEPDAVYLDGPTWYDACYCSDCRKRYEEKFGEPFPGKLSYGDAGLRKMNTVRDDVAAEVVRDLRQALAGIKEIPLLFNTTLHSLRVHRTGRAERTADFADGANTTEVHRPSSFWRMLEDVKLGESLQKVSLCYLPPGPYDTLRTYDQPEIPTLGFAYLMHGATPMLQPVSSYFHDATGGPALRNFLHTVVQPHPEVYYRSSSVRELGLVYSRLTAEVTGGPAAVGGADSFSGAFRALLHGHRHFDCLFDTQLNLQRLKGYRALVLPSVTALSDEQVRVLREFVAGGGSLIASHRFGLVDEEGRARNNFPLSEAMGLDYVADQPEAPYRAREYRETGLRHGYSEIPEAYLRLKDRPDPLLPVSDAVVGVPDLKRYIEYVQTRPHPDVRVLADLFLPAGGAFGSPLEFPLGFPPGITVHSYGKGKVIYIAAALETIYLRRRLPAVRDQIIALVDLALNQAPLLKLEGPSGVVANVTENNEFRFVHLVNYCGTMFEDANPLEWIAPVDNVRVQLRLDRPVRKVYSLYENKISFTRGADYLEIELPRLRLFDTLCVEKEPTHWPGCSAGFLFQGV